MSEMRYFKATRPDGTDSEVEARVEAAEQRLTLLKFEVPQ